MMRSPQPQLPRHCFVCSAARVMVVFVLILALGIQDAAQEEEKCERGFYGADCSKTCSGNCFERERCNKETGLCNNGCTPGYVAPECTKNCSAGTYGLKCEKKCSSNCSKGSHSCRATDGACDGGCSSGYRPPLCDQCLPEKYGVNCEKTCGEYCVGGFESCHRTTGKCKHGCKIGYMPPFCKSPCSISTYGFGCRRACSSQCRNVTCKPTNGNCDGGCKPGYTTPTCDLRCPRGTYGDGCSKRCTSHCLDGPCNHVTGLCYHGCAMGYTGEGCDTVCDSGYFGENCSEQCSKNCMNGACSHLDGKCIHGCVTPFLPPRCRILPANELKEAAQISIVNLPTTQLIISDVIALTLTVTAATMIYLKTTWSQQSGDEEALAHPDDDINPFRENQPVAETPAAEVVAIQSDQSSPLSERSEKTPSEGDSVPSTAESAEP